MEWQDEGLILGSRNHGESSAIVEVMTLGHGRHMGLVRGGRSSRMRPVLQPGNSATVSWRARLEEHLGSFTLEPGTLRAADLMQSQIGIYGIQTLASHLRLLPERDPHPQLYNAAMVLLDNFEHFEIAASLMVRFELALLEELGFGLDLNSCAATGETRELTYVSPKSGRAVSREAGKPWADKMLELPAFLNHHDQEWGKVPQFLQINLGFKLSSFFLERHIYNPRGILSPDERQGFIKAITKASHQ
ncbi:MAG: DNA repair protein RecO [Pseudomonadota bacterium]